VTDGDYNPQQALARDLLIQAAVTGASNHWARMHGYTVKCRPEQVRADGLNTVASSVWVVDLGDISRAITKLIERPLACGDPAVVMDTGMLTCVSRTLATARLRQLTRVANLPACEAGRPNYDRTEFEEMVADVVLQVAVEGEVIY
jgi:hypothetical protein